MSNKVKKIVWYNLAFMAFSTVWSFSNVINGFSEYEGLKAIVAWFIIFAIYFIPYALMVGELGSVFKDLGGGVSSWIRETISPKMAYYAGWTYWIVHMPYISQKPLSALIAGSWAIFQDARLSEMDTLVLQGACLLIFLGCLWLASKGMNPLKKLSTIAGTSMFVMSILYIILMMAAPSITGAQVHEIDWTWATFIPTFDVKFFTSLSILVFAVGGCEKISPYVNKMDNPAKGFPKGMIALAFMVALTAFLGTISLGMMFSSTAIPEDLMTNGAYYAFAMLGDYYGVGSVFVIFYALTTIIGQVAVMIMSIDAPLRMLLDSDVHQYIPRSLLKKNENGVYINGYKMVGVICSILIVVPALGIGNVNDLVKWLVKLNSVCMPLRYLWVFIAYIALKKVGQKYHPEYTFAKNRSLGMIIGAWCLIFTFIACMGGMYSTDPFQLAMNIITPFFLIGLGLIMPYLAKQ